MRSLNTPSSSESRELSEGCVYFPTPAVVQLSAVDVSRVNIQKTGNQVTTGHWTCDKQAYRYHQTEQSKSAFTINSERFQNCQTLATRIFHNVNPNPQTSHSLYHTENLVTVASKCNHLLPVDNIEMCEIPIDLVALILSLWVP